MKETRRKADYIISFVESHHKNSDFDSNYFDLVSRQKASANHGPESWKIGKKNEARASALLSVKVPDPLLVLTIILLRCCRREW